MTAILGISAFYHDSAAALVVDGDIVAAAQEERFTRRKHDPGFPSRAIEFCLDEAGLAPGQLDYVGFYDKPFLKFERLLETSLAFAPAGFRSFLKAMPLWLREKLHLPREMSKGLKGEYRKRYVFTEHHESPAASAFFPCPFHEAAILTLDGVALNCVGNGRILREGPFEKIWIQPAAGDAGGALGVALFIWHQLQRARRADRVCAGTRLPLFPGNQHGRVGHGGLRAPEDRAAQRQGARCRRVPGAISVGLAPGDDNRTSQGDAEFEQHANQAQTGAFREALDFLIHSKKWWLTPIIVTLLLTGLLIVLGGTGAAPFIYTLF